MTDEPEYDPRFVEGIRLFNQGDYFEAHEAWEELWHETAGPERRFIQGLIQAAVAVYHAGNGNVQGARRLFHSGRRYMSGFPTMHLGMDHPRFWSDLECALADILTSTTDPANVARIGTIPSIILTPMPRPGFEAS